MDCFPIESRLPEFGRRRPPPHLRYTTHPRKLSKLPTIAMAPAAA